MEQIPDPNILTPVQTADEGGPSLSFTEKIRSISLLAKEEFRSTTLKGKATLIGFIAMGGYEWGPGNETFTPLLGGQLLDVADGTGGILLSAGVTGGFVASQQLASGYLARKSARQFPRVSEQAFSYMNEAVDKEDQKFKPFNKLPGYKKFLYSLSLGSSFIVTRESFAAGNQEDAELTAASRASSLISGGSVAIVAAATDMINQTYEDNELIQTSLDWTIKNPLFFLGIVGAAVAAERIKRTRNRDTAR